MARSAAGSQGRPKAAPDRPASGLWGGWLGDPGGERSVSGGPSADRSTERRRPESRNTELTARGSCAPGMVNSCNDHTVPRPQLVSAVVEYELGATPENRVEIDRIGVVQRDLQRRLVLNDVPADKAGFQN